MIIHGVLESLEEEVVVAYLKVPS